MDPMIFLSYNQIGSGHYSAITPQIQCKRTLLKQCCKVVMKLHWPMVIPTHGKKLVEGTLSFILVNTLVAAPVTILVVAVKKMC